MNIEKHSNSHSKVIREITNKMNIEKHLNFRSKWEGKPRASRSVEILARDPKGEIILLTHIFLKTWKPSYRSWGYGLPWYNCLSPEADHPLGDPQGVPFEYLSILYSEKFLLLRKKVLYWRKDGRKEGRTYHFEKPKKHGFWKYLKNYSIFFLDCFWSPQKTFEDIFRKFPNWKNRKIFHSKIA